METSVEQRVIGPCQILSNMADRRVVHTCYVNKRCVFT